MISPAFKPTKLSILVFCALFFTLVKSQASDDKAICADNRLLAWITPNNLVYGPKESRDRAHGPCYCRPSPTVNNFSQPSCPEDQGFGGVGFVYCSKNQECDYTTQPDNPTYTGEPQDSHSTRLSYEFSALMTLPFFLAFLGSLLLF